LKVGSVNKISVNKISVWDQLGRYQLMTAHIVSPIYNETKVPLFFPNRASNNANWASRNANRAPRNASRATRNANGQAET